MVSLGPSELNRTRWENSRDRSGVAFPKVCAFVSLQHDALCQYFIFSGIVHNCDVIMGAMASQITSLMIVYATAHSGADQRKHQSTTSLAFVRGIHRWPVNSPHKRPVTRKIFPFDDVIMPPGHAEFPLHIIDFYGEIGLVTMRVG